MLNILVGVMNGTKARFFTLEAASVAQLEAGVTLVEKEGLFNPAHELSGQDLWSTSKTGRNRSSTGRSHTYDDHREQHSVEFEKRFAHDIAQHLRELVQRDRIEQLVLVSEPQFLGFMRDELTGLLPKQLEITELAKAICQMTTSQIHQYLADHEILPRPARMMLWQ
jgi:protein required for attachment to host cells